MRKTLFTEEERQALLSEVKSPTFYAMKAGAREAASSLFEASYPEQAKGGRAKWEKVLVELEKGFKPVVEKVYREYIQ